MGLPPPAPAKRAGVLHQARPGVYATCLTAYNRRRLHERWIDANQNHEDIQAEFSVVLRESSVDTLQRGPQSGPWQMSQAPTVVLMPALSDEVDAALAQVRIRPAAEQQFASESEEGASKGRDSLLPWRACVPN